MYEAIFISVDCGHICATCWSLIASSNEQMKNDEQIAIFYIQTYFIDITQVFKLINIFFEDKFFVNTPENSHDLKKAKKPNQ